ncbi:MAG: PotD/PotF family extracellular solute-binding protein [Parvibaculaceae bacterium]
MLSACRASRRRVLKGTAGAAAVLAMPGLVRGAAAQENVVRIMGVSTAALDDWSDFEKETGLTVEFTSLSSDPGVFRQEVVANAAGERFDILLMDGGIEDDLGVKGFFMPITGDGVPSWPSVPPEILKSPLALAPDGTQYGLPVVMNADGFGYVVDEIGEDEPLSWSLVFESDKTRGRVGLENTWLTTFPMAAMVVKAKGLMPIKDVSDMTPEEAKAVADYLIERKRAGQFRTLWSTWEESIDLFTRKEVIVANCWEPAVKELQRKGMNIRYASTREGYNKWVICAYVPSQVVDRGGQAVVARALEGFLGGAYAARIAVLRGYATARSEAGMQYAKDHGFSAEDIEAISGKIAQINERFKVPDFWQNATPTHVQAIEAEFDRFRSA